MARPRLPGIVTSAGGALWMVGAALLAATGAQATEVVARVAGVVGSAGVVRVSICAAAEYSTRNCRIRARVPARPGLVEVRVPDVPPGVYAIIAHHDRTDDDVVHTDWLGIPTDGVGVSRNALGAFGPPAWDQVALQVGGPAVAIDITLRREPGG